MTHTQFKGLFGRISKGHGGGVTILDEDGCIIDRLDADVYPVGSDRSARYEHVDGIVLTRADTRLLGIEIEDDPNQRERARQVGLHLLDARQKLA
jgi:hypothetical protein